jgi:UDP-glucose:glycoprotein glucosyltransferase
VLNENLCASSAVLSRPKTLTFDHIYPPIFQTLERAAHTAILYGSPTTKNFRDLHSYLFSAASRSNSRVEYVFRHMPVATTQDAKPKSYLSGYGVTLDLKKMDYLALDDRRTRGRGVSKAHECSLQVLSLNIMVSVADSDGYQSSMNEEDDASASADLIVDLLNAYPLNDTMDANVPLTEEELLRMSSIV